MSGPGALIDLVEDIRSHVLALGCHVLFISESGSRCFGTHGPHSDHDLKVIFRRPLADYLSIEDRQDTFTWDWRGHTVVAFDIRRAAHFLASGNPSMHELAWSETLHFSEGAFQEDLGRLSRQFFRLEASLAVYAARLRKLVAHRDWQGETVPVKRGLQALHLLLSVARVEAEASPPPVGLSSLIAETRDADLAGLARDIWRMRLAGQGALDRGQVSSIRSLAMAAIARIEDTLQGRPGTSPGTADDRQALQDWIVRWIQPEAHAGPAGP